MRQLTEDLGLSTWEFSNATLMRFLIARWMDAEKAAKMLAKWHEWRDTFVPSGFMSESEVADELKARKIYLQGSTRCGNQLLFIKASKHYPSEDKLQFKKFVAYLLDKTNSSSFRGREVGNEKLVRILDLQGLGYKNVNVRRMINGLQFLQIVILTTEEEHKDLVEQIGDVFPEDYGGKSKPVAIQDVTLSSS